MDLITAEMTVRDVHTTLQGLARIMSSKRMVNAVFSDNGQNSDQVEGGYWQSRDTLEHSLDVLRGFLKIIREEQGNE